MRTALQATLGLPARTSLGPIFQCLVGVGFFFLGDIPTAVDADEIRLRRGGSYQGTILKMPEETGGFYEFKLANGGLIRLAKSEVDSISEPQSSLVEYQEALTKVDLETVKGQLLIADWCRDNRLRIQREFHLRKIIALDPDHQLARRLLGYEQDKRTGKWVLLTEYFQSIGYIRNGTSMQLPLAKVVETEKKTHDDAVRKWQSDIQVWLRLLNNQKRYAEVRQKLEDIDDVKTVPILIQKYNQLGARGKLSDNDRELKSFLMMIIAKFDVLSARTFLANEALFQPNDVLQDEAEQYASDLYGVWLAKYLITRLNRISPAERLEKRDQTVALEAKMINRAATILKNLEVDVSDAILPLINLLYIDRVLPAITTGKKGNLGGATFDKNGGVGMQQGAPKPKKRPVRIENEQVKVTLLILTEQRFEYSKLDWLNWYLSKTLPPSIDLRRTE
uniref:Uncharacterized protein n=1 Tax=uncultured planctomycete 8FN TaxID=455070 RepID=A9LH26_9BACT|nr:hypothetical protein 8FN_25 [uncultured planctomycete 8FN]